MTYQLRAASAADVDQILALLPRLAAFDMPPQRSAEHLWQSDAELLRRWGMGDAPQCFVFVAVDREGSIVWRRDRPAARGAT